MKKTKLLLDNLVKVYSKERNDNSLPAMTYKIKPSIKNQEAFLTSFAAGALQVEAASYLGAAYGFSHTQMGMQSGYLAEGLELQNPRFHLRPIWLGSDGAAPLSSQCSLAIPNYLTTSHGLSGTLEERLDWICSRVIELGYNAIILGSQYHSFPDTLEVNLNYIINTIHDFGLKIIIKPNFFFTTVDKCPFNAIHIDYIKNTFEEFTKKYPAVDYIFWESQAFSPECYRYKDAFEATQYDIVQAELGLLEKAIANHSMLIYYVPTRDKEQAIEQTHWLSCLIDEMGPKTLLSFSAVSGEPWQDHLPPHPFWDALRKSPDTSATYLLPILNAGAVRQGEGLWPTLTLDLIEQFMTQCYRHCFAGAIVLANRIPLKDNLLDCCLWVAAQVQWKNQSAHILSQTWFAAKRPDFHYSHFESSLKNIRQLAVELSFLRSFTTEKQRDLFTSEECRLVAESILSRLKHLQMHIEKHETIYTKKCGKLILSDYITYFIRDAKKIVTHFLSSFNVPLLSINSNEDNQEGYWTHVLATMGKGRGGSGKLVFLEHPRRGAAGSRMEKIYEETRGPW